MFIRYYLELDLPETEARRPLVAEPSSWVPGIARETDDRTERLLAEVGFEVGETRRIDKEVEFRVGNPRTVGSATILPVSWTADIEIGPLGSHRTQLSISARYRPPLGTLGQALDKALLHRVAEATIKDFLDRTGERITSTVRMGVG